MKKNTIGDLDDILMYQLYRIGRLLRFHLQKFLDAESKATPEQFFLLYRLYMKNGQTQRQLADTVLQDHPNITRLIDRLEERGYVSRETVENNRRAFNIILTDKGIQLFDSIIPVITREREQLLKGISAEEQKIVKKVLLQMGRNMEG